MHMVQIHGFETGFIEEVPPPLELVLGDGLPEPDTLLLGDIDFKWGRLAAAIRTCVRTRTPRRS